MELTFHKHQWTTVNLSTEQIQKVVEYFLDVHVLKHHFIRNGKLYRTDEHPHGTCSDVCIGKPTKEDLAAKTILDLIAKQKRAAKKIKKGISDFADELGYPSEEDDVF